MAAVASADGWFARIVDNAQQATTDHPIVAWGDDHMTGTLHAWILFPDERGAWVSIVRADQVDTARYDVRGFFQQSGGATQERSAPPVHDSDSRP